SFIRVTHCFERKRARALRAGPCHASLASRRSSSMSPRPDLGPKPQLGYAASRIDRASERRADADALAALERQAQTRAYAIGGELVALKKIATGHDPLFSLAEARSLGAATETVFLGLLEGRARFALALEAGVMEALKAREE